MNFASKSWLGLIDWHKRDCAVLIEPEAFQQRLGVSPGHLKLDLILGSLAKSEDIAYALTGASWVQSSEFALQEVSHYFNL